MELHNFRFFTNVHDYTWLWNFQSPVTNVLLCTEGQVVESPAAGQRPLCITLPQLDGFVILQGTRRDDVFRRVARCAQHHICK